MTLRAFGLAVYMSALLALAAVCLFWPDRIQRVALRYSDKGLSSRMGPLRRFVRSPSYRINVRVVGAVALLMFCLLLWASVHAW